jgi:hypothetical protein
MPLTRSFRETVQARARRDVKFRQALLTEAMQALLDGDLEEGRAALRSYMSTSRPERRRRRTMSATAKLIMDGDSQAVLLPDEFRFEGVEVRLPRSVL